MTSNPDLSTLKALDALDNFTQDCGLSHTAVYIDIASRIAGGLAINYVGQPSQGSKKEFARTVIELANALSEELGERVPTPTEIVNMEEEE